MILTVTVYDFNKYKAVVIIVMSLIMAVKSQ